MRFWYRSRDAYSLDPAGYLADLEATLWGSGNPAAVATTALAKHRALVPAALRRLKAFTLVHTELTLGRGC